MSKLNIFQIYYSEDTRDSIEEGFIPLSNMSNERPDWFEYWPIRNYILNNQLNKKYFYGFLSPKFSKKTNLNFNTIIKSLNSIQIDNFDVISFSPFYDQISFYKNIFEQTSFTSPDVLPSLNYSAKMLFPNFDVNNYLSSSLDTIFCNYFIATGSFWLEWFNVCEKIFHIAENYSDPNNHFYTTTTTYNKTSPHIKTFIIERIANLLIKNNNFRSTVILSPTPTFAISEFSDLIKELILLDSLKISYNLTARLSFIEQFSLIRTEVIDKLVLLRNPSIKI